MNCRHNSCAPNNLPLAEVFQECCLEKYPTCAPVTLETPAQRGRQPPARYETKRERKPMYPMINAIWYFAVP